MTMMMPASCSSAPTNPLICESRHLLLLLNVYFKVHNVNLSVRNCASSLLFFVRPSVKNQESIIKEYFVSTASAD
jgi:hypothetical protein